MTWLKGQRSALVDEVLESYETPALIIAATLLVAALVGQLDVYDQGEIQRLALIFGLAVALAAVAASREASRRVDDEFGAAAPPELAVERSVRDRLYGERAAITATPTPRGAGLHRRLLGGRYRLLERVGAGGTATVYRARDERLKRDVAVKMITEGLAGHPPSVQRFRREAELCARLAHPNIVAILDTGVQPRDFSVMEFVRGVDAGTLLQRCGRLTPDQTVHVVAQVCEALAYAHEQEVLHRDVSPGNILIGRPDGTAQLADFGIACDALDVAAGLVAAVTGTPGYVAPEILRGAAPSPRSDLYSLGVVAYRLLAGPSRARRDDPDATAPLPTAGPRMPPLAEARPGLPRGVHDAVQQAIAHRPDDRQDSVAEFRAQLVDGRGAPLRLQRDTALFPQPVRRELPYAA